MATPSAQQGDKVLAAVAYLLTIITGVLVYILAKPEDKYARWHALQAIGLGVALIILGALLSFATFGLFAPLFGLVWLVVVLVLAYKAYNGESVRLPLIAEFADKNA